MGTDLVDEIGHAAGGVCPAGLNLFQMPRQLEDALHEHLGGTWLVFHLGAEHLLRQLLEMIGQQGDTGQLQHHQRAMHLVQTGEAGTHARLVPIGLDKRFQRLTGVVQGLEEFALNPIQGKMFSAVRHFLSPLLTVLPGLPLGISLRAQAA